MPITFEINVDIAGLLLFFFLVLKYLHRNPEREVSD